MLGLVLNDKLSIGKGREDLQLLCGSSGAMTMSLVMISPMVLIPKDKGITSKRRDSRE